MRKKLLSVLLVLSMVIGLLPTTAITALATESTPEAVWGTSEDNLTESGALTDALSYAKDTPNSYIRLMADLTGYYNLYGGPFTLDLNGHTIEHDSHVLYLNSEASVTLTDSSENQTGKVICTGEGAFALCLYDCSLIIDGGTYQSAYCAVCSYGTSSADVTINGGTFISGSNGALDFGDDSQVTINGGTYSSPEGRAAIIYRGYSLDLTNAPLGLTIYTNKPSTYPTESVFGSRIALGENQVLLDNSGDLADGELSDFKIYTQSSGCAVSFDANGGIGSVESVLAYAGIDYTLPECTFTAPDGTEFVGWLVNDQTYQPGDSILLTGSVTLTAQWAEITQAQWALNGTAVGTGSLASAVAAVSSGKADSIKMLMDVTAREPYKLSGDSASTVTVDLNGQQLVAQSGDGFFQIWSLNCILKDSVGTGSIGGKTAFTAYSGNCTVTVESGSYSGTPFAVKVGPGSANLIITGGSFSGTSAPIKIMPNSPSTAASLTVTGSPELIKGSLGHIVYEMYQTATVDLSNYENAGGTVLRVVSNSAAAAAPTLPAEAVLTDETGTVFDGTMLVSGTYTVRTICTIRFDGNGGTGTMAPVSDLLTGTEYTLPECGFTAPTGKAFKCWTVNGTEYDPGDTITVNNDTDITAVWVDFRTVSFDANGGTGEMAEVGNLLPGAEYTLPECGFTAPAGKVFKCWSVNGEDYAVGDSITIEDDTTVAAVWVDFCTVSFDANGGAGEMSEVGNLLPGAEYTLPECGFTAPAGKVFKCWSVNGTEYAPEYAPGDTITINNDTTVSAVWANACTVSFDANGGTGTMEPVSVVQESWYDLPECTFNAPEGKGFKCWSVNGTEYAPGDTITVNDDTTVIVVWADKCTITFIAGEGATGEMEPAEVVEGGSYTLPNCEFEAIGNSIFKAWLVTDGVIQWEYRVGRVITVEADLTVTPIWKNSYTVSFAAGEGATGEMAAVPGVLGSFILPECGFTAPEDMIFAGWSVDDKVYAPGDTVEIVKDITVTAQWAKDPSSFDLIVGGVGMADGDYLANGSFVISTDKPEDGYAYYKDGKLTLHDYEYSGKGYLFMEANAESEETENYYSSIFSSGDLEMVLEGKNTVGNTAPNGMGIALTVLDGDLTISGTGSLDLSGVNGIYAMPSDMAAEELIGSKVIISGGDISICVMSSEMGTGIGAMGDLSITGGSLAIDTTDAYMGIGMMIQGVSTEDGAAVIAGGDVEIIGSMSNMSMGMIASSVCIGTPPTLELLGEENFLHPGPHVNIETSYMGIVARGELAVYNGVVRTSAYGAVEFANFRLGDNMTIQVPVGYEIDLNVGTILDAYGDPADIVLISEGTCEYAEEYSYNLAYHWQPCLDPNCEFHVEPSFFQRYGEHTDEDGDGVCDVCGFAAQTGEYDVYVGGFGLEDGAYLSISGKITDTKPNSGGYAYYKDGVLTLEDYLYTGGGYLYETDEENGDEYYAAIYSEGNLKLVLKGENTLIQTEEYSDCISANSVTVSGSGKLELEGDYGIYAYVDVTISGVNVTITGYDTGIYAESGDVNISGGTVNIMAYDGIYTYYNETDYVYGDVNISGGKVIINAYDDGICADYGDVNISGGTVSVTAYDDGIYAWDDVSISGGTVDITADYYGIYAGYRGTISGGNITVKSEYKGIYSDYYLEIYGKNTVVNVSSYNTCAIYSYYEPNIEAPLGILVPEEGCVSTYEDGYAVFDTYGEPAYEVSIAPSKIVADTVFVGGVELESGDYLATGSYVTSGKAPEKGGYAYYKNGVLTLNDYEYTGVGYEAGDDWTSTVYSAGDLTVMLMGNSTLVNTAPWGSGITADNRGLLTIDGEGTVNITAAFAIDSYGDLVINGGEINIVTECDDGITEYINGIYAEGNLTIHDGDISIDISCKYVDKDGYDDGYAAGLYASSGDVTINGGDITISVSSGDYCDGIYSSAGGVTINGGNVTIVSPDGYGIDCYGKVTVSGSNVSIDAYYEGIYNYYGVEICGGNVTIMSDEYQGIDAYYGDVVISGGTVTIEAYEEGIYAEEGNVDISGGNVTITSNWYEGIEAYYDVVITGGDVFVHAYEYAISCDTLDISGGSLQAFTFNSEYAISCASGITVHDEMTILAPIGGEIAEDSAGYDTVFDTDGVPATFVYITDEASAHSFGTKYGRNATYHWLICTDNDCDLSADGSMHQYFEGSGYAEHSAEGVCVCGYDATKEIEVYVGGLGLAEGEYLGSDGNFYTEAPDCGYANYTDDGTLTLNNYEYEGPGYAFEYVYEGGGSDFCTVLVYSGQELTLKLIGESTLVNTGTFGYYGDGVFTVADLTVEGVGTLSITADDDGFDINESDLIINGGTVTLTAGDDGLDIESGKITMNGGTLDIVADDHGIDIEDGDLLIEAGEITMNAGDDGFNADENAIINGGTIYIEAEDYAIDAGLDLTISGGDLTLVSRTESGIEASGEWDYDDTTGESTYVSGGHVTISGGKITIKAGCTGIESAGNTTISGGHIVVSSDILGAGSPALEVNGTLTLGGNVDIIIPDDGDIGTGYVDDASYQTIVNGTGNTAAEVELLAHYTVTWVDEAGDAVETETVDYGRDAIKTPGVPVKEGYTGTWVGATTNITKDTVIELSYEVNTYTVTFTVDGKQYGEIQTLAYGEAVTAPNYTVPEGHTFSGWTVPETMPAENLTLNATLTVNTYKVTWNVDSEMFEESFVEYGKDIVAPTYAPAKTQDGCTAYTFSQWVIEDGCTTMPAKNITATAVFTTGDSHAWGETVYDFVSDGSSCTAKRTCTRNAAHYETIEAEVTSRVTTQANCQTAKVTTYTATFTEDWAVAQTLEIIGNKDMSVHKLTGTAEWTQTADTHAKTWTCCGTIVVAEEEHEWSDNICTECGYGCSHTGGTATCTAKAVCEHCGQSYGELNTANHKDESPKDYICDDCLAALCNEHTYVGQFQWQSNLSGAEVIISCEKCQSSKALDCTTSYIWNAASSMMVVTATAQWEGESFIDVQAIKLAVSGDKLIVTNSAVKANDTVEMIILVAGYTSNGQMTGYQIVENLTGVTETELKVSGELKVFFLQPGTNESVQPVSYEPLMPCVEF